MKLGISELFTGAGARSGSWSNDAAQLIEEIGYNSVWLPEHVVFFPEYKSQYPYESGGAQEVHRMLGVIDPLVLASQRRGRHEDASASARTSSSCRSATRSSRRARSRASTS